MNDSKERLIKVIYFDEIAANDYLIVKNGGKIDWTTDENKEKIARIVGELEAEAKSGFNFLEFIKSSLSGKANAQMGYDYKKIVNNSLTNSLISDYVEAAKDDKNVHVFREATIYPPENSITMYKMVSSYLNVVPKDQLPIDLKELNNAILGERGYYQMVLEDSNKKYVLRLNNKAFRDEYTLMDLSRMTLTFYGIKVGSCFEHELSIENEFVYKKTNSTIDVAEIVEGISSDSNEKLEIYDVVLAGVMGA